MLPKTAFRRKKSGDNV